MSPVPTVDSALRNVEQILAGVLELQPGPYLTLPRHVVEYVLSGVEIARMMGSTPTPGWGMVALVLVSGVAGWVIGYYGCL